MTAMNHHHTQYHSPFTEVPLHGIEAHDLMKLTPTGQAGRGRGCTGAQNGGVRGYLSHTHTIHVWYMYLHLVVFLR